MSESVKQVILRDPKTNEILIPKIIGTLGYEPAEDGTLIPPYSNDADTLGGKTPDQFAAADHNHDDKYAEKEHDHSGVYATPEQLNEVKTSVAEGKALVAAAVSDKGVETAADAEFATIAANIAAIESGTKLPENVSFFDFTVTAANTPSLIINNDIAENGYCYLFYVHVEYNDGYGNTYVRILGASYSDGAWGDAYNGYANINYPASIDFARGNSSYGFRSASDNGDGTTTLSFYTGSNISSTGKTYPHCWGLKFKSTATEAIV